jgi:hypothetical protein
MNAPENKELTSRSDSPDPAEQGREEPDLRRWLQHDAYCASWKDWKWDIGLDGERRVVQAKFPCTCGLDEALASSSQQKQKEKEDK